MASPARIAKGLYWDRALTLVSGCTPVSPGCDHCWGASEAHMRGGQSNPKIRAIYGGLTTPSGKWNGQVRFLHERLEIPVRVKKPTVWAIWMDLFHKDVHPLMIRLTLNMIEECPQHTFLALTKRPEVALEHFTQNVMFMNQPEPNRFVPSPLPKNLWLGVTAENQETANERIPILLQIQAAIRFVSVEPMLGPVDLRSVQFDRHTQMDVLEGCGVSTRALGQMIPNAFCKPIDWVICGGETGPGARPMHPDWARNLRDQCQAAGVPFFFKQWGEWYPDSKGIYERGDSVIFGNTVVHRVGKKIAGRLLDGVEWNEMPEASL